MASQTAPQEMLKFKTFKEELHALLDEVLDQAETPQTAAEEPVVLDWEWILEKMRDQIATDKYVLEPGAIGFTQGLGNLLKLPREMRDIIYGHAIADGSTAILRASKQTNKEASKLVFEKGIYRLLLGFNDNIINPRLSQPLANNILNLNIRVNGRAYYITGLKKPLRILHMFNGSAIRGKNCVVTTECDAFTGAMYASQVVRELDKLTGFERVILDLDLDWYGEPWPDTLYDFQEDQILGRIDGALSHQEEILEPKLGKGHYDDVSKDVRYRLVFNPRK